MEIPQGLLLIDGQWVESATGETFETVNPATGERLAELARGREADVDRAVAAARRAFEGRQWGEMPPAERGRILQRISQLLRQHKEELATLESMDTGKPISQARTDVDIAARYFEYYGGVADKIFGQTIPITPQFLDYTVREPLGVCGHIIPWNYPLQIGARSIAPALAAGNTCVLKPAEEASLTALKLGEMALEAGLPRGVLNVVTGLGPEAGAPLASHPGVDHISFTGSVETGIKVMQMAATQVTPVILELGGKSPNIVFRDADLERALPVILNSIIQNAGQTCSAGSRLLVEREIQEDLTSLLAERMQRLRLGPGLEDPDLGPLISRSQLERVLGYIEKGKREGARLVTGGGRPQEERLARGYFVLPTLFDGVSTQMCIAQEEIFGPVLTLITFKDEEEAVEMANATAYGLVTGIWTRDIQRAHKLASKVKSGQVFINTYGAAGGVEMPFGGYKGSGFGREKGMEALFYYTQVKNVCIYVG